MARSFTFERATLSIGSPARGVVVQTFAGHATTEVAERMIHELDYYLAQCGSIIVFDHWYEATGYDSPVRGMLTEFTRARGRRISATYLLIKSPIIAMGLQVAGLLLGASFPLHAYSRPAEFERVLAEVVAGTQQRVA